MHKVQQDILNLMDKKDLTKLSLRKIASLIGKEGQPQTVKHHVMQLKKKELITVDSDNKPLKKITSGKIRNSNLVSIPILGSANCGMALLYADQVPVESYLKISEKLLKTKKREDIFILQAEGSSLNKADIDGKRTPILDGDYVVIDGSYKDPKNGDYVLSIIDGMANLKKFKEDRENNQIILLSESTEDIPPIYIHSEDDYMINGKIVQVIKKPKFI